MAGRTGQAAVEPAPLPPAPQTVMAGSALGLQASARQLDVTATKGERALGSERTAHVEAWRNYELPEVQKLITGAAGLLSQCRLYVGVVDDDGTERPLRDEVGKPIEGFDERFVADAEATLGRFVDRNGSQRGLLQGTAECWDVTGEVYMVGWPTNEDGDPAEDPATAVSERWEALSRSAITKASGRWVVELEPGVQTRLPAEAVAYRMWRSHPRFPDLSRSWLMAAVEPCRDLRVFTAAQRAAGRSSTVADLLIVPSEASPKTMPTLPPLPPGAPKPAGAVDAAGKNVMGDANAWATFLERIIGDAVLEVLRDTQAGRTVIPPVIAMAQQYIEKIKKVSLNREVDTGLKDLVEQARHRVADAADAESEFLFGLGETNRWNGAQIADTDYRRSFRPKALAIADSWTMELLWGGLRGLSYRPEQYRQVRVLVDPKGVVAEPDLTTAATEGAKLGFVGQAGWLMAHGMGDEYAASPEESAALREAFGRSKATGQRQGGGEAPEEVEEVNESAASSITTGNGPADEPPGRTPARRVAAAPGRRARLESLPGGRAAAQPRDVMGELLVVEQVARARLEEAAESALDATLHRTGSKLRNWTRQAVRTTGEQDLMARVLDADTAAIHTVLGPERCAQLAGGQYQSEEARRDDLYAAALAALLLSFGRITADAMARAARILGWTLAEAEVAANMAHGAEVLAGGMKAWADRVVFDPIKGNMPGEITGLRVPTPVLRRAAAAAGGAAVDAGYEPTVDAVGGWVFGPTVMDAASAAASSRGDELSRLGFQWVYGDEPRRSPWEPHMLLDGIVLTGPDDPRLAGKSPMGTSAFPGDHYGCRCDWVPVVNETTDDD